MSQVVKVATASNASARNKLPAFIQHCTRSRRQLPPILWCCPLCEWEGRRERRPFSPRRSALTARSATCDRPRGRRHSRPPRPRATSAAAAAPTSPAACRPTAPCPRTHGTGTGREMAPLRWRYCFGNRSAVPESTGASTHPRGAPRKFVLVIHNHLLVEKKYQDC